MAFVGFRLIKKFPTCVFFILWRQCVAKGDRNLGQKNSLSGNDETLALKEERS